MALCRCKDHPPANNRTNIYLHFAKPFGYPNTSSFCGIKDCENPGLIFISDNTAEREVSGFNSGDRFFYFTNRAKVKVEDNLYTLEQLNSI